MPCGNSRLICRGGGAAAEGLANTVKEGKESESHAKDAGKKGFRLGCYPTYIFSILYRMIGEEVENPRENHMVRLVVLTYTLVKLLVEPRRELLASLCGFYVH